MIGTIAGPSVEVKTTEQVKEGWVPREARSLAALVTKGVYRSIEGSLGSALASNSANELLELRRARARLYLEALDPLRVAEIMDKAVETDRRYCEYRRRSLGQDASPQPVLTAVGGLNEVLRRTDTGMGVVPITETVREREEREFTEHIVAVIENPDLREEREIVARLVMSSPNYQ